MIIELSAMWKEHFNCIVIIFDTFENFVLVPHIMVDLYTTVPHITVHQYTTVPHITVHQYTTVPHNAVLNITIFQEDSKIYTHQEETFKA